MGKVTGYSALAGTPDDNDLIAIVDISDTTQGPTGTTKRQTVSDFLSGVGGTGGTTPDATSTIKGKIQLTGDLGGTAASPTVTKTYTKTDVGLSNVDNTSDAGKPISTATATALSGKAATSHTHAESDVTGLTTDLASKVPTTRTVNGHALSANISVTADDVLPTQTSNSGKFLTTNGTTSSWDTPAGGGGGQTLYTKIVAPSGGDYTTLGAAIAAASAGDTIFVRKGTYTEGAITSSLSNITIIGENWQTTVLNFAANTVTFSGANLNIQNLSMTFDTSTAKLTVTGAESHISGCYLYAGTSSVFWLSINSARGSIKNCLIKDDSGYTTVAQHIQFAGSGFLASQCSFFPALPTVSTYKYILLSSYAQIDGCRFDATNGGNAYLVSLQANSVFSNNYVYGDSFSNIQIAFVGGQYVTIRGNTVYWTSGVIKYSSSPYSHTQLVDNNFFNINEGSGGDTIRIGSYCVIAGNYIHRTGTSWKGIICDTDCTIMNNYIENCSYGILAGARSTIIGNVVSGFATAAILASSVDSSLVYGNDGIGDSQRSIALADGATITPDANAAVVNRMTLGGNRTLAAPTGSPQEGQHLIFRVKQDATGSRTLTWNAIYRFSTTFPSPTLTTTANATDIIEFTYNYSDSKWDCTRLVLGLL